MEFCYWNIISNLIIQWGVTNTITVPANNSRLSAGTFPISFTNCLSVIEVLYGMGTNITSLGSYSNTGIEVYMLNTTQNNHTGLYSFYIAIGT